MPFSSRRQINEFARDAGLTSLFDRTAVREFVRELAPAVGPFRPNPASVIRPEEERRLAFSLIAPLGRFTASHNIPQLGLEIYDPEKFERMKSAVMYFSGQKGMIGVSNKDLFRLPGSGTADDFIARLYHELTHGKETYDQFRVVANQGGIPRIPVLDADQSTRLVTQLRRVGVFPNEDFQARLLKAWSKDPYPVTAADETRAQLLYAARLQSESTGPRYIETAYSVKTANSFLSRFKSGESEQAIVGALGESERAKIWGSASRIPERVQEIFSGNHDPTRIRSTLTTELDRVVLDGNMMRARLYGDYRSTFHEVEAWLTESRARAFARQYYRQAEGSL
jgi:hypothetical protein